MSTRAASAIEYAVPTYKAPDGAVWYHVLHGSVPGHQIDFILRPELPQGALKQQHFSHLSRLIKYIEPCQGSDFAFAVVNLSRDDTQHEPGRGGVGLILGLRVHGAKDHVGRPDPPFSHALVSVGRELDKSVLEEVAVSFYHHVLGGEALNGKGTDFYRAFALSAFSSPVTRELLSHYISRFSDLPRPGWGAAAHIWQADTSLLPRRLIILHEPDAPFRAIARCAARIAAMLYRSDIRWTSITTGREADIPNGVSIRLLPRQAAKICGLLPGAQGDRVISIEEVPEGEADIARQLFGATLVQRSAVGSMPWSVGPFSEGELDTEAPTIPQLEPPDPRPAGTNAIDNAPARVLLARSGEIAPLAEPQQMRPGDRSGQNRRRALIALSLLSFGIAVPAALFLLHGNAGESQTEAEGNEVREAPSQAPPRTADSSADPARQEENQPPSQDPGHLERGAAPVPPPNEKSAQAKASARGSRPSSPVARTGRKGEEQGGAPGVSPGSDELFGNPNLARPQSPRAATKLD
jgi:hypothetical protein